MVDELLIMNVSGKNTPASNKDPKTFCFDVNHTWVQCESSRCLKWRLVPNIDGEGGELDLGKAWFCHMNPDTAFSNCKVPQVRIPSDSLFKEHGLKVVYSLLPAGSLVLAKASKWPWWPAILCPDPDLADYVTLDTEGDVERYHVEFLGKPHSRYWVSIKSVECYRTITMPKTLRGVLRKSYALAIEEAAKIREMECEERLRTCHFKPPDLLSQAQGLMEAIEKMMSQSNAAGSSCQGMRHMKERPRAFEGKIEEDGDVLIVEGFRFESAVSREELKMLTILPANNDQQSHIP